MEVLLVLTVIAAQLLRMTYLHRTQPGHQSAIVLRPVHQVILAKSSLYFAQSSHSSLGNSGMARLGASGTSTKISIGIQVLWRGWLQLESLCEGWQLCSSLN